MAEKKKAPETAEARRRRRTEKLQRMAAQTESPAEAEAARRILAAATSTAPAPAAAAAAANLTYAGKRDGVPHWLQAEAAESGGALPGVVKVPRQVGGRRR